MAEFVTVGRVDQLVEGEATAFVLEDEEVAITRVDGDLYAFSDICTHRGCNLSMGGEIEDTSITCECHGSTFDIQTGAVLNPPATEPLPVYDVREQDGELQVARRE
jgi:3-phenylpropionate/trans-cinnamate dioxygenase ferredoxin subunit